MVVHPPHPATRRRRSWIPLTSLAVRPALLIAATSTGTARIPRTGYGPAHQAHGGSPADRTTPVSLYLAVRSGGPARPAGPWPHGPGCTRPAGCPGGCG